MQKTKKPRHSPGKSNRVRRGKAKSLSAQQTIPYLVMHPDGVCQLPGGMLTIYPTSELYQEIQAGNWTEETEFEKLLELKTLIQNLKIPTYFATMGASNCVNVEGHLPKDKEKMIRWIDKVIGSVDEKELRRYRENLRHL